MRRRPPVALVLVATILTAKGGIDLTATAKEYISEGIKYQKLIFRHDNQTVEYNPPPGWKFHGAPHQLQLMPPKKNFAEAVIEAVPLSAPQPLDEKVNKALEQQFMARLPPGSQFVTIVGEEQNPVLLNGNRSFEVTVSYAVIGEKFFRSAIFVNLPNTQLIFQLTARKDDFEPLHHEFRTSISSWQWVGSAGSVATAAR
jgi:hypothetical protein